MTKKKTSKPKSAKKPAGLKRAEAKRIEPRVLPPSPGSEMLELGMSATIAHLRRKGRHHPVLNPLDEGEGGN